MKKIFFSALFMISIFFFSFACKTIQVKENTEKLDILQKTTIDQTNEVAPENVIIEPKVKEPETLKQSFIAPQTVKQISKAAVITVRAAPAKVVEISHKIAKKVKVETKNVAVYWPLLLSILFVALFVAIMVSYVVYKNLNNKKPKRRKNSIKTSKKSKK